MRLVINELNDNKFVKVFGDNKEILFSKSIFTKHITCLEDLFLYKINLDESDENFIEITIYDNNRKITIAYISIRKDMKEHFKEWMRL